jgi:hypothetical protein
MINGAGHPLNLRDLQICWNSLKGELLIGMDLPVEADEED